MRYRLNRRGNFESAQIGATKNVTGIRWRRDETYMNRNSSVQSDAVSFDGTAERGLFDQVSGPLSELSFMFH